MPLSASSLASDARRLMADLPQSATFSRPGRRRFTVSAAVDMAGGGEALADDGSVRISTAYASATVVEADCPWRPRIGDRCDVGGGQAYRVASVRATPGDPCLTLGLEAPEP